MSDSASWELTLRLSRKALAKLYTAIFFVFAPVAMLATSSFAEPRPWPLLLASAVISGSIAVAWALSFNRSRWFLLLLIPLHAIPALLHNRVEYSPSVGGIGSVALIVLGYVFFISFISGEGTRTLRLQTEINLAQEIHSTIVPPIDEMSEQLEIYGASIACSEVGGDLLDVSNDGATVGLYLADVTGHGVKAGVMMAMVKSALRARLLWGGNLGSLLSDLSEVVAQVKPRGMFATFAGLRFNGSSQAEFALAGHPPILHYKQAENSVSRLAAPALPLGVLIGKPGSPRPAYASQEVSFAAGDLFVLFTDGFVEVVDSQGVQLGDQDFEKLICLNASKPLPELFAAVVDAALRHGPREDDQTLLLARVRS